MESPSDENVGAVPPLSNSERTALLALYSVMIASGRITAPLPSTECEKIAKVIEALQKVYSDHCPIAES